VDTNRLVDLNNRTQQFLVLDVSTYIFSLRHQNEVKKYR
jgi:hypothetical protein